ncbi:phytoene desaturase family protein [Amycolatopsis jejuensis]|uniref:phytoene desaturase family protein n=1 Tax=Amycolatopsis jejuensis TaxID=330084 RepID=UPI000526F312|nr:NAD(P)/FAD-dependent oxidoreductase [Amycolatopsis jejuensis]
MNRDVVIVGGGHNGLAAAAYLARAGLRALLLERLPRLGGAAISSAPFPGVPARLSRYSYLVSMLPDSVARELDLDVQLRSRATASYTPAVRDGRHLGLYVEREEGAATRASFRALTGGDDEYDAWRRFYAQMADVAKVVAPTFTEPLPAESTLRAQIDDDLWRALVERPLGEVIEQRFADDLVRGVVATDGLIGIFRDLHDPSLAQNRCFLYHLAGNGTGEWRVPVGGMGKVSEALARAAAEAGAELRTDARVDHIDPGGEVVWHDGSGLRSVHARYVLANVAPWTLQRLLGQPEPETKPEGSQVKINFLVSRLPKLRSGDDPRTAFAGTFHVAEGYSQLQIAHAEAAQGRIPSTPPGELYCHSLTDDSLLGDLSAAGVHTLTYFGLHLPAALFAGDHAKRKEEATSRAIAAIDAYLAEPLMDCVLRAPDGRPCVEVKTPQDVEADLAMPGGHIFHGDLSWPWATEPLDTPARRWGVETPHPTVLRCGSGARRGGAVSCLGGHNAARAVLELAGS